MAKRMDERFEVGERVEIYFRTAERWLAGTVTGFEPPGVWVRTADERPWFVTNGRRIRPLETEREETDAA